MALDEATQKQLSTLIGSSPVMLFMKGNPQAPQCGFSAKVVSILNTLVPEYGTFDVLSDQTVREGIKELSSWPTIPQLYIRGEFVGGCDIIEETYASGELQSMLGIELREGFEPSVTITDAAAEALRQAAANAPPDQTLHLGIDASYQTSLFIGPNAPEEVEIESNGLRLRMDRLTANRAENITVDVTESPQGTAFRIHIPNAAIPEVGQISVQELKQKLDAGERFEFFDVRSPEERATASISGARLLTQEESTRLEKLPKDTTLVFHCHSGGRSQAAAEHFAALGFSNVWNLTGGIDAWSLEVDPEVPRY